LALFSRYAGASASLFPASPEVTPRQVGFFSEPENAVFVPVEMAVLRIAQINMIEK